MIPPLASHSKSYQTRYPDIIAAYAFAAAGHKSRRPLIYNWTDKWQVKWRRARRLVLRAPGWAYLGLGSAAAVIVFMLGWRTASDHNFVNATSYFTAAALFVGGYSAWVISKQNQANFIRDFLTKFIEKKDVYESWRYLFYLYKNADYQEIEDALAKHQADQEDAGLPTITVSFDMIRQFNPDREAAEAANPDERGVKRPAIKEGLRRWHPQLLPESPEEGRIDEVLSYFNILGDYYERGTLDVDEIGDVATFYLRAIGNCEAFRAYLKLIIDVYNPPGSDAKRPMTKTAVRERYGYPPFGNLCLLLNDLEELRDEKETAFYDRFRRSPRSRLSHSARQPDTSTNQG